jgi:D-alanyl-D-alanine dipeptidase
LQPVERYVAYPAKGSLHNRGGAVDLTLCNIHGRPLPMTTAFDDFSDRLQAAMERPGFTGLPTEWWHHDLVGWHRYGVLDIPLDAPKRN